MAVLQEICRACSRVDLPAEARLAVVVRQRRRRLRQVEPAGAGISVVVVYFPLDSAAAAVTILNDEPGG